MNIILEDEEVLDISANLQRDFLKGDKGDRGVQGEKGDKGETGDIGPSNTLIIGTVETGEEASATITGESPNQTLNLVLPKGDKGDKGDVGETGPQGEVGLSNVLTIGTVEKGDNAEANITGESPNQVLNLVLPKGDKGDKGETGEIGPSNTLTIGTVEKGEEASASIGGDSPNQVLNLVLPKGDKGDTGDKGDKGDKGDTYIISPSDYKEIEEQVKTDIQPILENIENVANQAEVIAKGKSDSVVKDTWAEMEEWLKDVSNKGTHKAGDNLYIKAKYKDETMTERQPDYWIAEALEEQNEKGYYYEISELESDKPDLEPYAKTEQFVVLTQEEYDVLSTNGTYTKEDGTVLTFSAKAFYYIIEEE